MSTEEGMDPGGGAPDGSDPSGASDEERPRKEDQEAWPRSSVLVEVELPEPPELPPRLVELIGSLRVVLLGSYLVPEQTTPEQAQEQLEEECADVLDVLVEQLEEAGADVDARMVFTPDLLDTASRVAREEECDAVLLARPITRIERVLVPLRGPHNLHPVAGFLGSLLVDSDARITFLHVQGEDEGEGVGEWVLTEATELAGDIGIDARRVETRLIEAEDTVAAVLEEARKHDLLVLGESEPEVPDLLFSRFSERLADQAEIPVFVIRRRR